MSASGRLASLQSLSFVQENIFLLQLYDSFCMAAIYDFWDRLISTAWQWPVREAAPEVISTVNNISERVRRNSAAARSGYARVLVVDDNPESRLTLQTVLEAVGYQVDTAASGAEAVGLMDAEEYALVLSDLSMESPEAGLKVIEHARMKTYRPATAIVTASRDQQTKKQSTKHLIRPENVPELLTKVASLIGSRASRRAAKTMR